MADRCYSMSGTDVVAVDGGPVPQTPWDLSLWSNPEEGKVASIVKPTHPFGLGPDSALGLLPSRALSSGQVIVIVAFAFDSSNRLTRSHAFGFAFLSRSLQLLVALGEYLLLPSFEFCLRRDIADRTM